MSLRPVPARWFEALVAHADAAGALEALAVTGAVELELEPQAGSRALLLELQPLLDAYSALEQRYAGHWPAPERGSAPPAMPVQRMQGALDALRAFASAADPLIARLQLLAAEHAHLGTWEPVAAALGARGFDCGRLADAPFALERRAFLFDARSALAPAAPSLAVPFVADDKPGMIVVGTRAALEDYQLQAATRKGRALPLPALPGGSPQDAAQRVAARRAALERERTDLLAALARLAERHAVARQRGEIERLAWFARTAPALRASEQFASITGWTDDGARLEAAMAHSGLRGLVHFPPAPAGSTPPLVLRNPAWAKPFELFSAALGVPGQNEADPSRLLALAVPLIFGYMFGDAGQGMVLVVAAFALQRRFPLARLLMAGGMASVLFGLLFGSVFGQEHWIAPLWLRPLDHPLTLLAAPLAGGTLLLVTGLALRALQSHWAGEFRRWLLGEAGIALAYLGLVAAVASWPALWLCAAGALWQLAGGWLLERRAVALRSAAARFAEELLRLAVNTLSFVRIGAFALAHAGLAAAVNALAADLPTALNIVAIVLGNAIVIVIEVIVVSVQTTRLVLFEFFIRFLRGTGRPFRPITPPSLFTGETFS
jgi:V/A-type H+-transporting ATPase subunit I